MEQLEVGKKTYPNRLLWTLIFFLLIGASAMPIVTLGGFGSLNFFRVAAVLLTVYAIISSGKTQSNVLRITMLIFISFVIFCFFSIVWAQNKSYAASSAFNYLICIAFMLSFTYLLSNGKNLETYLLYCGYVMIIFSLLGVFETFTGFYIFEISEQFRSIKGPFGLSTPIAAFGNPNDFAFALLSILPFFFYALNKHFKCFQQVLGFKLLYIFLILYISFVGQTRITILILCFMVFVRLLCSKKYRTFTLLMFLISAFAIVLSELFGLTHLTQRVFHEKRIRIWVTIINDFKNRLLFGKGVGNGQIIGTTILNPHFWFLELFADLGIIMGCIIALWFLYMLVKNSKRHACFPLSDTCTNIIYLSALLPMSVMSSSISFSPILWISISFTILLTMQTEKYKKYDVLGKDTSVKRMSL